MQQLRVPHALEAGHDVELAVPAPTGVRIDLEQFDLALRIGAIVEPGVVAATEPLEQAGRVLDQLLLDVIRQRRLVVADLGPVGAVRLPLRLIAEDLRQVRSELAVVHLEQRQCAHADVRIADEADRILGAGQELLHQHATARELRPQAVEVVEKRTLVVDDRVLGDALRAVAAVGLKDSREHGGKCRALVARTHVRLERHRHVERMRDGTDEALVVAGSQRRRRRTRVGNAEHLQQRRDVQLLERVVVEALVTEVQDEIRLQLREIALQRGVVVQETEPVGRQLRQRILEFADGVEVFRIERAVPLHSVRQARVAHQNGDVELLQLAADLADRQLRRIRRQQDAARHHAEILIPVGHSLGGAVMADIAEAGLLEQLRDAGAGIEALGVELVGDHAGLVIDDDLTRDEPVAFLADRAFAADEMVFVDPLP